jgi:hypothetical protein
MAASAKSSAVGDLQRNLAVKPCNSASGTTWLINPHSERLAGGKFGVAVPHLLGPLLTDQVLQVPGADNPRRSCPSLGPT